MRFQTRCLLLFLMAFGLDLLASLHYIGLQDRDLLKAVGTMAGIGFLGHFGHTWFIEFDKPWQRAAITAACTLGAMLGTAVVILCEG